MAMTTEKQLMFSLRIVSVDSYMCEPVPGLDICRSEFRKSDVKSVPVIRVFGSTPAGQTTCLHVHGVFPYLMIPYCGPDVTEAHWSEVEQYLQQLASSLDTALNSAGGKTKSNRQHVFKIVLLRGIPFYGYHEEEELFLKIYFYLPGDIKRASDLLQAGMVLDRQFQPHEAHVPYILQLFLDYNLYGMNLLHARNCWFRLPIGKPDAVDELPKIQRPDDIPPEQDKEQTENGNKTSKCVAEGGKLHIPTMSQLGNFNWNLLREKAQSSYSQVHRNLDDVDNGEDSELPQTSKTSRKTSKNEESQANLTQSFSCSELCKSLLSKTLSPKDSEDLLSGVTSPHHLCPLHTHWSGQNVPSTSKLPTDVGRQSTCDLEVDVLAADISNRDELKKDSTTNPGIASIWEDEKARRRERNEDSQIAMDQSQPRVLDKNLSDREAHFIQMLYDALDRHKEDNSLASSFNDSLSFTSSHSTRKTSSEASRPRRESKDLFASSGETVTGSIKREDEELEMSSPDTLTPVISVEGSLTQGSRCSLDEDISTLELMRRLQEGEDLEMSIATQRGNGPLDEDNDQQTPEEISRSQNLLRKQLSLSQSNSQHIATPGSSPDDTQALALPSDDEDVIENFEMSQRWDSAIHDLLQDLSEDEIGEVQDSNTDDDDNIPQLDGASDEPTKVENTSTKRLGSTKRSCITASKSKPSPSSTESDKDAASSSNADKVDQGTSDPTHDVNIEASKATSLPSDCNTTSAASCATTCVPSSSVTALVESSSTILPDANLSLPHVLNDPVASTNTVASLVSNATESVTEISATACESSASNPETYSAPSLVSSTGEKSVADLQAVASSNVTGVSANEAISSNRNIMQENVAKDASLPKNNTSAVISKKSCTKKRNCPIKMPPRDKYGKFLPMNKNKNRKKGKNSRKAGGKCLPNTTEVGSTLNKEIAPAEVSRVPSNNGSLTSNENVNKDEKVIAMTEIPCARFLGSKVTKTMNDAVLNRVEDRTNVFTSILSENPGVTLYDQSKSQKYTHSAVINLNSLPTSDVATIPALDGTVIKITSTPVKNCDNNDEEQNSRTRKSKAVQKLDMELQKEKGKPTRTRRPRQASKNSYLEDPLYETVFDSDWDSDSESGNSPTPQATGVSRAARSKRSRVKNSFETKRRRNRKPKVITKWIIVNRFKGISSMKIGLWKIPATKRVKLTPELLRLYELYSPTKVDIKIPPVRPPVLPNQRKSRPMGKRSKHMLAILCPFGPKFEEESNSEPNSPSSTVKNTPTISESPQQMNIVSSEAPSSAPFIELKGSPLSCAKPPITTSVHMEVAETVPDVSGATNSVEKCSANAQEGLSTLSDIAFDKRNLTKKWFGLMQTNSVRESETASVKPAAENPLVNLKKVDFPQIPKIDEKSLPSIEGFRKTSPKHTEEENNVTHSAKTADCAKSPQIFTSISPQNSAPILEKVSSELANFRKDSILKQVEESKKETEQPCLSVDQAQSIKEMNEVREKIEDNRICKLREEILSRNVKEVWMDHETNTTKGSEGLRPVTEKDENKTPGDALPTKDQISKSDSLLREAEEIMRSRPVLTSILTKVKPPLKKTDGKKKNVRPKKEPKKKKSSVKFVRNSPSPLDSDRELPATKAILPVSSRTVEPLCNRVSPTEMKECTKDEKETVDAPSKISPDVNMNTFVFQKDSVKTSKNSSTIENSKNDSHASSVSPVAKATVGTTPSPEKKSSITIIPSTKRVYSPSRKVTRNSVAVKLNSISAPKCMFTPKTDDSKDPFPPLNALLEIVFPSPFREPPKSTVEPPRPWSPMLPQPRAPVQEETEANDLLEEFAESFGAATKMLSLVDDSVFKNMDCIGQLIGEHQASESQKEPSEQMELPTSLKEDNEKMLKHFDKIFEDVSSNAATSQEIHHGKRSSVHLDEFEEETLMEFIDEMTSPTQPVDSNSQQSRHSTFPMPPSTPLPQQDDSNSMPVPQIMSPAVRDTTKTPVLPVLPNPTPHQDIHRPQRPMSTIPQVNHPSMNRGSEFFNPNGQHKVGQGRAWQSDARPQSCFPGHALPPTQSIQRPASAMGHWPNRATQSQPSLYHKNQMQEMRKNQSSPTMFSGKNQNYGFQSEQSTQDYSYFGSRGSIPQPQSQPPYPPGQYSFRVENQGYRDPSQLPRPASVIEPPLQVFHTHVHHHHHVHSINNSQLNSSSTKIGSLNPQMYPQMSKVKDEIPIDQVKIENVQNSSWPVASQSNMVTPEQNKSQKPLEKPKSRKTQFYVPNSPFPYPKSASVAPIHVGPQGLLQTLTYVETSVSQSFVSGKSNIYALAGVSPSSHRCPKPFSESMGLPIPVDSPSVILKGSCQINSLSPIPQLPSTQILKKISKTGRNSGSRSKVKKTKTSWNPSSPLPTLPAALQETGSAKTPYGLMKQNSLSAVRKKSKNPVKVTERKRKTISDFRAPPDTPTISLTGSGKGEAEGFDLSQDMFEGSLKPSNPPPEPDSSYSAYTFVPNSEKSKTKLEKHAEKQRASSKPTKTTKSHLKRNSNIQRFTEARDRPVPKKGEELILNFITGEWEIVPVESVQKDVPVLFSPEEQTLSKLHPSDSPPPGCSAVESETEASLHKIECGSSSSDDLSDFAEAKKKRKRLAKPSDVKRSSSTPEYMVSAVDLESNSPRLKLKLKKTPPIRGKPQLSTLVSAGVMEILPQRSTPGRILKKEPVVINDSGSSDSDDFALSVLKKRKKRTQVCIQSEGSDSDFRIEDASDVSTDDASEIADEVIADRNIPPMMDFSAHLHAVKNMYTLKPKICPASVMVTLEDSQIATALTVLTQTPKKPKRSRATPPKSDKSKPTKPFAVHRSKDGRFISVAKMNRKAATKERNMQVKNTADTSTDGPAPAKLPRIIPQSCLEIQAQCAEEPLLIHRDKRRMEEQTRKSDFHPNDPTVIKTLLQECCDQVVSSVGLCTKSPVECSVSQLEDTAIEMHSGSLSCAVGQGNGSKSVPGKHEVSPEQQTANEENAESHDRKDDDEINSCEPPSPPDDKSNSGTQSCPMGTAQFVYRTVRKPPTHAETLSDLKKFGLVTNSTSKEPFYGEASDAQTTSHRLSNLPPYVKKPRALKTLRDMPEHHSDLPLEGSIHHWTVLMTASKNYNELENAVLQQKAAEILPPKVNVWDHIDAVTKLPQYPSLSKVFLNMDGVPQKLILRPAVLPPSRDVVQEWLDSKRKEKGLDLDKKYVEPEGSETPFPENNDPAPTPPSFTQSQKTFQRSISLNSPSAVTPKSNRPRRVSFDLSNVSKDDGDSPPASRITQTLKRAADMKRGLSKISKLAPVEGSPIKPPSKEALNIGEISPPDPKFANLTSPVTPFSEPRVPWDSTMSFTASPSTLQSIQTAVTPEGSSSAIKTLVGSSDKDETSPLTFLISGSFTPPSSSTQDPKGDLGGDLSSLKKLPQSTPNVSEKRERKHVLRKLAFTPIGKRGPTKDSEVPRVHDVSPKSPGEVAPNSMQLTPAKTGCLRKTLLTKKFQPPPTADSAPSPVVLETPNVGKKKEGSQIDGPTLDNTYGFKAAQQHLGDAKSLHVVQHITSVSLELHIKTRIDLRPDPDMDEIRCLFYCLESDSWAGSEQGMRTGAIVVDPNSAPNNAAPSDDSQQPSTSKAPVVSTSYIEERELFKKSGITHLDVIYVRTELELFLIFAQLMHKWDPDILVGYEVQMLSWGFLLQRAAHLRCDLCRAISRVPTDEQRNRHSAEKDEYGADNASELHIVGRIVLNLWRLMRTEVALYDYGFESVAYHLLHERHPKYDHQTLTNWFDPPSRSGPPSHVHRWRVIDYYVTRVRGNMRMLAQQDFIGRTSELARLFGIQFYEVLTRGSQFRVESMMLRSSRAHNLIAVTPSILQRAQMRAPEVIALVMEPESKFYHVPVLVLDFQSLYPSMVIAYNICFSTCLGRVELLGSDAVFTFGCTSLRVPAKTLNKLLRKNLITINPSGVAFVKSSVRKGVMPQMLDEILTTRIMVKNSMKKLGSDEAATKRMLDHRQLGLKLIANVTYGYTAANFSGRMPCVEVGDSIVHKARETLERAIKLVTRNSTIWENARVVYGDTDSMFIALEGPNKCGCTKDRAFEVGKEIAAEVTADNPTPVKLKFEKVYLPCVLQTKKRYVGYAFETEDQKEPSFDAKGIETVRRDGTPATAKILEKMLKILFDTRDVSKVKEYVLKQCSKILNGRTTLQDCIIAKEYRGKQYYKPGAVVPALNIARKLLAMDKRAEPRVGERVPYVIVHGAPGTPLYQLVRTPLEVLKDPTLKLNGAYYVTKQILPALDRVMSLLGVDVFLWHRQLPRTIHVAHNPMVDNSQNMTGKKTISQFFKSKHCLMCKKLSVQTICDECLSTDDDRQQATAVSLSLEAKHLERAKAHIEQICMQCTGASCPSQIRCVSLDCPILYKLHRATDESSKAKTLRKALQNEEML